MKKLTKKERFQESVLSRFHVYNSIFATLPYDSISNTGNLLPVFTEFCKLAYSKKLDPKTIVEDFFLKYCETYSEEDKISLIFRFIQYIERQVVLFDAIEDASFTQINNMDGVGTLRNLKELGESSNKQKELKKYLRSFKIKPVLTAHPTQFYPGSVLGIITDLASSIEKNDLTFDDILNNWGIAGSYVYDKQDSVGNIQNVNLNTGDNYTYKLDFDEIVSSNEYQWYKNGTAISGATSNQLSLSSVVLADAGRYDCRITNLTATGETIEIKPIFISIASPCHQADSLELVDFYNATNGNSWTNSWDLSQPINTWQGVYLNASGCVDSLILSNNNLSGSLPNLDLGSIELLSLENNA